MLSDTLTESVSFRIINLLKGNFLGFKRFGGRLSITVKTKTRGHHGLGQATVLLFSSIAAILVSACVSEGGASSGSGSSYTSPFSSTTNTIATSASGASANTPDTQCVVFQSNASDYSNCLACKTSMCPCTTYAAPPNSNQCIDTDLGSCTVNITQLVECVHNTVVGTGGTCAGLECGSGQVADFASCTCQDSTPATSIGPAPGMEDQGTPYLEPGFSVGNATCAEATAQQPFRDDCLLISAGSEYINPTGATSTKSLTGGIKPQTTQQAPVNVLTDTGYIRWDLGLDASQFSPGPVLAGGGTFAGSWASFPLNMSMYYQLKANTTLSSTSGTPSTQWNDCVEHFSGYDSGTSTVAISSNAACASVNPVTSTFNQTSSYAGTASISNLSANGSAANANLFYFDPSTNSTTLNVNAWIGGPGGATTQVGIAKNNNATPITAAFTPQRTTDIAGYGFAAGTGLFSNIGYYKYTWGPVSVVNTTPDATVPSASGSVSGRIAVNTNLGYTSASAVESSAQSPAAISDTITTRDCSSSVTPNSCVLTSVYRAPGGAILSQSFAPQYSSQNQTTIITGLPSGVTAVSTPKIIEDVSQLDESTATTGHATTPARLRVFVRASDGNIYMSRFENGDWNTWMSLGRPWLCNSLATNGDTGCQNLITGGSNAVAPVYQPIAYTASAQGANPLYYTGTTNQNDGLSIAGEPVVVSYMGHDPNAWRPSGDFPPLTASSSSPQPGVIAIFVRVSHMQSNGVAGAYHNTVWYTFASSAGHTPVVGQPWDFDSPLSWSNWMMVDDGNAGAYGPLFKIQGNPTVVLAPNDGQLTFHVFGTSSFSGIMNAAGGWNSTLPPANAPMLHPPTAPPMTVAGGSAAYNTSMAGGGWWDQSYGKYNWYGYGMALARTSLSLMPSFNLVNTSPPSGWSPAMMAAGPNGALTTGLGYKWAPIRFEQVATGGSYKHYNENSAAPLTTTYPSSPMGITSDWSYTIIKTTAAGGPASIFNNGIGFNNGWDSTGTHSTTIRLFAMEALQPNPTVTTANNSINPSCASLETNTANPDASGNYSLVSPCNVPKEVVWAEFTLSKTADATDGEKGSNISYGCIGTYNQGNFAGTPQAISFYGTSSGNQSVWPPPPSQPSAAQYRGFLAGPSGAVDAGGNKFDMYLFGRAPCPDSGWCDTVNPSLAILATTSATHCTAPAGVHDRSNYYYYTSNSNSGISGAYTANYAEPPHAMIYYGETRYEPLGPPPTDPWAVTPTQTPSTLSALNTSSDVSVFFDNALNNAGYDLPMYFITRNSQGNITHGFWEQFIQPGASTQQPEQGTATFSAFSMGAFTN